MLAHQACMALRQPSIIAHAKNKHALHKLHMQLGKQRCIKRAKVSLVISVMFISCYCVVYMCSLWTTPQYKQKSGVPSSGWEGPRKCWGSALSAACTCHALPTRASAALSMAI